MQNEDGIDETTKDTECDIITVPHSYTICTILSFAATEEHW